MNAAKVPLVTTEDLLSLSEHQNLLRLAKLGLIIIIPPKAPMCRKNRLSYI